MADYRYLLGSLLGGQILAEVAFTRVRWSHVLNAPGSFEGTLALDQPASVLTTLQPLIPGALGQLAVYVERDGVILWGGPLLATWEADLDAGTGTLRGEGWHSYVRRRVLRQTITYTHQDQTLIAADLVGRTQTAGQTPVIDTSGVQRSDVFRDRTYNGFERPYIGQLIEDLSGVVNGFDFRYESTWDSGAIATRFLTSFPNTGRLTNLVFEVGRGVSAETISVDATSLATHVDAVGAGEGDAGLRVTVANAASLGVYPLLDDVLSATDVSVAETLDSQARRRLARVSAPVTLPEITVDPGAEPTIGSYIPGDVVTIRGGYGLASVDGRYRIVGIAGEADDTGRESVRLTPATLDAFQ